MIDDIDEMKFFEMTKNITTKEKWEQILCMESSYNKAHYLFSRAKYNKKVASILFKFFNGQYNFRKIQTKNIDLVERLKLLSKKELNNKIVELSKTSSTDEIAKLFNIFQKEIDLSTIKKLLKIKPYLKNLIEKPSFSKEVLKEFYFGKDNDFKDSKIGFSPTIESFEIDLFREDLIEIIKELDETELMNFTKKSNTYSYGVFQSNFEEFLDDIFITIDDIGEDFFIKYYQIKANKLNQNVFSIKSENRKKMDLMLKMKFEKPVVFINREFDVNNLSKAELIKLKENNITPLLLSKEKINEYGKGLYFFNTLNVLNSNSIRMNDYIETLNTKLDVEDVINMFNAGYFNFRQVAYDTLKNPNMLVNGNKLDFESFKELIKINEKV